MWKKQGLIFSPFKQYPWSQTHCWVPFAESISDQQIRVYFASRNEKNLSQTGFAEFNPLNPFQITRVSEKPVLELGSLGCFDDSAVIPSWIVNHDSKKYLYYIGWTQGKTVPYFANLGLAISEDNGRTFQRVSKGPVLDRNSIDPYMTASACVRIENGIWRMWYLTNTLWEDLGSELRPKYHIKYAESVDGIHWKREGVVAIDFKNKNEYAISRPCVIKENGLYKMWYSYRGENYRIGYAESTDGIQWNRLDEKVGITVSETGFDSTMIEYPFVFDHQGRRFMLYNGNEFGKEGVGMAQWEKI